MFRVFWLFMLIISSTIGAYLSRQNNISHKVIWSWLIMLNGLGGIYLWTLVSKKSDNLIFDNVLFDVTLSTVYVLVFMYLGCGETFSALNWFGVAVVVAGMILMKV